MNLATSQPGAPAPEAERDLRRGLYKTALMALFLPPFVGGSLMAIAGYFPMPQFYGVFFSFGGLYVLVASILVLALTRRAVRFFTAVSSLAPEVRARQVAKGLRGLLAWTMLGLVLYSVGGALSANFSLVQLGVRGEYTLAEHARTVVGIIPAILITAFPIFFHLGDLLGRHFAPSGVIRVATPLSTKLFVLGLFTPVLIDTLLISYFFNWHGTLPGAVWLLWFGLIGVAAAGTWLAWKSINQSFEPLREYLAGGPQPSTPARLIPNSLDELGLLTDQLRLRLEAEQRLSRIIELAPDLIAIASADGQIKYMNAGGRRMLGLPEDFDVTTTRIADYHDAQTAQRILDQALPACLATGYWEGENAFLRRDGTSFLATQVVMAHRRADGTVESISTITRDLSERRQAEEKVRAALADKELLLKEIYHRVKNNLQVVSSLLTLQARGVADSAARGLLQDGASRVKSMALVHEQLYQDGDLSRIAFASYARQFAAHLSDMYDNSEHTGRIDIDLDIADLIVGVETAVPLGLIVNELISNAYKHAFPNGRRGRIQLSLKPIDDGRLELTVADDGVGLPPDFDPAHSGSLGMQLVVSLTEQLGGTLEYGPGPGKGSRVAIRFVPELPELKRLPDRPRDS